MIPRSNSGNGRWESPREERARERKNERRASPGRGSRDGAWRAKLAARRDLHRREGYRAGARKLGPADVGGGPDRASPSGSRTRAQCGRLLLLDRESPRPHRNSHAGEKRRDGARARERERVTEGEGERRARERDSPLLWPCSDGRICDVASNSVNRNRQ